jgi:hypothetical protein
VPGIHKFINKYLANGKKVSQDHMSLGQSYNLRYTGGKNKELSWFEASSGK